MLDANSAIKRISLTGQRPSTGSARMSRARATLVTAGTTTLMPAKSRGAAVVSLASGRLAARRQQLTSVYATEDPPACISDETCRTRGGAGAPVRLFRVASGRTPNRRIRLYTVALFTPRIAAAPSTLFSASSNASSSRRVSGVRNTDEQERCPRSIAWAMSRRSI